MFFTEILIKKYVAHLETKAYKKNVYNYILQRGLVIRAIKKIKMDVKKRLWSCYLCKRKLPLSFSFHFLYHVKKNQYSNSATSFFKDIN